MGKRKGQRGRVKAAMKPASPNRALSVSNGDTESPRAVLKARIAGRDLAIVARRGSYRAANNPRSRVQTPYGGSGDQQADPWSRRIVRELSRDMDRNSDTYRTLLDDFQRAVVGEGVRCMPRSSDQAWNKTAAALLDKTMRRVRGGIDARQMRSGYQLQGDFVRAVAGDGDAAILKLDNGRIQLIESEQITAGTSNMTAPLSYTDGITVDAAGAPQTVTLCPYNRMTGALDYGGAQTVDYEHVEFAAIKTRFSQTRGLPILVAGLEDWERIDSYKESEVIAAEQGSMIYGAIKYPPGNMAFGTAYGATQTGNDAQAPTQGFNGGYAPGTSNIDWHETSAGYLLELPNGVEYMPVNPGRPNRDAAPFLIEMIRQFCANAGLPYEIVYNDLRGLSWSIQRALVALARDKIGCWQANTFSHVFAGVYRWMIARLIEAGDLEEVDGWDEFDLVWPQLSWPDEGKEFEAQQFGLRGRLTSRHRVFGTDWRGLLDEHLIELEYASDLARKYNAKYPEWPVTPQDVLGLADEQARVGGGDERKDGEMPDAKRVDETQTQETAAL